MQAEGVDSVGRESEKSRDLNAGLRLFEMLDLGGKTKRSRKDSVKSETRMIRHHTEASIVITLLDELRRRGSIVEPDLAALKTGAMTSLEIGPATAPLLRVVNQILRLLDLTSPEAPEPELKPAAQQRKQQGNRHTQAQQRPKPPVPPSPVADANPLEDTRKLFKALKGDLEYSGMTDIVVRREDQLSVLLTLDNRFVTDQALELLHSSTFRVIGKVTQIWPEPTDFINLYRRSVLSLVPALPNAMGWLVLGMLGGMAKAIDVVELQRSANEAMDNETYDPIDPGEIKIGDDFVAMFPGMMGPAIQILPLAICA